MEDTDVGVFCRKNATFYYMDFGNVPTPKSSLVERIVRILVTRDLIELDTNPNAPGAQQQYEVISIRQARDRNMAMQPLYISQHAKKAAEARPPQAKKGWGRHD